MIKPSVIVTGGANGIGYGCATCLASEGHSIVILDSNDENAKDIKNFIKKKYKVKCEFYKVDITNYDECSKIYQQILIKFDNPQILINCAGIMPQELDYIEKLPISYFSRMIEVHLNGSVVWSKLAIPLMKQKNFGRIINLSSFMGLVGSPMRLGYVSAKAALIGMTKSLAVETARFGITVNAIAPGFVLTETLKNRAKNGMLDAKKIAMSTPVGRWANVEDITRVIKFLVEEKSSYITGVIMPIDGGISIGLDLGENVGQINSEFSKQMKEIKK